jgi:hypothetical protein
MSRDLHPAFHEAEATKSSDDIREPATGVAEGEELSVSAV